MIWLAPGTYDLPDEMCSDSGGSAICLHQSVTIKAAVAGTVVLDAMQQRRVIHISGSSTFVQLIGLEITGGQANSGGGMLIEGSSTVTVTTSTISGNTAYNGGGMRISGSSTVTVITCVISGNDATYSKGGGLYFHSGTLRLSTAVFSANTASDGGHALWFETTPGDGSFLTDIVVRDHGPGQIVAFAAGATVPWRVAPGTYMPPGTLSQNFDTFNTFNCSAGHFGAADDLPDESCSGLCPTGHYCLARTSTPTPCKTGTYNPAEGASIPEICVQCSAGKVQPLLGSSECAFCPTGTFQSELGETSCFECAPGGYCDDPRKCGGGWTACPEGTFNALTGSNSSQACIRCGVGTASAVVGANSSAACASCNPGTFSALTGQALCTKCASGKHQGDASRTQCESCTPGHYCKEGAPAPLPLRGRHLLCRHQSNERRRVCADRPGLLQLHRQRGADSVRSGHNRRSWRAGNVRRVFRG